MEYETKLGDHLVGVKFAGRYGGGGGCGGFGCGGWVRKLVYNSGCRA